MFQLFYFILFLTNDKSTCQVMSWFV